MLSSRPDRKAMESPVSSFHPSARVHPLRRSGFLLAAVLTLLTLSLRAQIRESALSDGEVEQIRDARYVPNDCVLLFVKFLDLRTKEIQDLYSKPRRPGREQDTHDLIVQFTSIAD